MNIDYIDHTSWCRRFYIYYTSMVGFPQRSTVFYLVDLNPCFCLCVCCDWTIFSLTTCMNASRESSVSWSGGRRWWPSTSWLNYAIKSHFLVLLIAVVWLCLQVEEEATDKDNKNCSKDGMCGKVRLCLPLSSLWSSNSVGELPASASLP